MKKPITTDDIVREAFKDYDPFIINEISREITIRFLGETNIDLYIVTTKKYIEKRVRNNLINIQEAINKLVGKTIRNIYVNQELIELNIEELKNKEIIKTININDFKREKTIEISGENDIVKESSFKYNASIFNRKKINIELHNRRSNKQYRTEISTSILTNPLGHFKKRKLVKEIKGLLQLNYEPTNNDTQEVIEYLNIN